MKAMRATKIIYWSHLEYPSGFYVPMRQVVRIRRRRKP